VLAEDLLDELDTLSSPYDLAEPTDLAGIRATLTDGPPQPMPAPPSDDLYRRIHGAWLGRAAGCLLGKPVEKIPRQGIREILQAQGRWPLDDWFTARGLPDEVRARWPWNRRSATTSLAENIDGMPEDDDLNFPMLNLALLEEHGSELRTSDVAEQWLRELPAGRVFTAERVAYREAQQHPFHPVAEIRPLGKGIVHRTSKLFACGPRSGSMKVVAAIEEKGGLSPSRGQDASCYAIRQACLMPATSSASRGRGGCTTSSWSTRR
jgi:hypothetical protein